MDRSPIREKLGKPIFEEFCLSKFRCIDKNSKGLKVNSSSSLVWQLLHLQPRNIEFDLWIVSDAAKLQDFLVQKNIQYVFGPEYLHSSEILLVGECALASQTLLSKRDQIFRQLEFLENYLHRSGFPLRILYLAIVATASSSQECINFLEKTWKEFIHCHPESIERFFGFGLMRLPFLTEDIVGDLVLMTSDLQNAVVSLDDFREETIKRFSEQEATIESLKKENEATTKRLSEQEAAIESLKKENEATTKRLSEQEAAIESLKKELVAMIMKQSK